MNKGLIIFLIFGFSQVFGQKPIYRNLVMEGGGSKGIAYGGALLELENRGVLEGITRTAGTSAGAIQACLLAIGYSPQEIVNIIDSTSVEIFNDDGFVINASKRLKDEYGWFKGDVFLRTLENLIFKRTGNRNLTFSQLHRLAISYPFRDLYVTGCNLSKQKVEIFSYETYPNMRIADAVRVSMSIPLYYRALWVDSVGKTYEKNCSDCSLFVDGGLMLNFPIAIFDNEKYLGKDSNKKIFNPETLGLRLEACEQIDFDLSQKSGRRPYEISDFNSYLDALTGLIMHNDNPQKVDDIARTIYINDLQMSARVRKVSQEEKLKMMTAGTQGVIEYFNRSQN